MSSSQTSRVNLIALPIDLSSILMHNYAVASRIFKMKRRFTALIKKDEGWWIGWVQEIPGVNSQGKTRGELRKNLRSALQEALEIRPDL